MPRRILLLITDLQIGGTPTVVRELAIRLNRGSDVLVEVACLSPWGPVADQLSQAGVPVYAFNATRTLDFPRVVRDLVRLVNNEQFDTVFSFLIHANAVAAAASVFLRGVRFIQSIQTTQPDPRWHWKLQTIVQIAAQRIVVPSPSTAGVARDWALVPAEKTVVIPNAVEISGARSTVPSTNPRPYPIGFIGRLDPIKRLPDLLAAVQKLGDVVHLHIFGDGPERARIECEIDLLDLSHRVTMHGFTDLHAAMPQIGLLVLPSDAEGFGLVLIEAMAWGVPVVATNVAGIRDVVTSGVTGLLVPPRDPEALGAAILTIVSDPNLRANLIESGKHVVAARFNWDAVVEQYRRLLG